MTISYIDDTCGAAAAARSSLRAALRILLLPSTSSPFCRPQLSQRLPRHGKAQTSICSRGSKDENWDDDIQRPKVEDDNDKCEISESAAAATALNGVRKLVGGQLAGKLVRGQRTAPANQEEEEEEEEKEEGEEEANEA